MGQPRVLCTALRPDLRWVAGEPVGLVRVPLATPARMHWRLLSANNRQLGRSARTFAGEQEARDAAAGLAESLLDTELEIVWIGRRYGWGWTVTLGREVEAISGRGYERSGHAGQALHLFLAWLPAATEDGAWAGHGA